MGDPNINQNVGMQEDFQPAAPALGWGNVEAKVARRKDVQTPMMRVAASKANAATYARGKNKNSTTRKFLAAVLNGRQYVKVSEEKKKPDANWANRLAAIRTWKTTDMAEKMTNDEATVTNNWQRVTGNNFQIKNPDELRWSQAGGNGKIRPFFIENAVLRGGRTMRGRETTVDGVRSYAIPTVINERKLTTLRGTYMDPTQNPAK